MDASNESPNHILINAVVLPPFSIFDKSGDVNHFTLQLLLSLSKACYYKTSEYVQIPRGCPNISREVFRERVLTETQVLQDQVRRLKEEILAKDQETAARISAKDQETAARISAKDQEILALRKSLAKYTF